MLYPLSYRGWDGSGYRPGSRARPAMDGGQSRVTITGTVPGGVAATEPSRGTGQPDADILDSVLPPYGGANFPVGVAVDDLGRAGHGGGAPGDGSIHVAGPELDGRVVAEPADLPRTRTRREAHPAATQSDDPDGDVAGTTVSGPGGEAYVPLVSDRHVSSGISGARCSLSDHRGRTRPGWLQGRSPRFSASVDDSWATMGDEHG